jgi:hypothetical protein
MTSITRRCRSVSPELSALMPGGRPGRARLGPSWFGTSFIACTGSSRPWERSWAVMVALSAVVVTSAPLDGLPCSTTVVAFERLRQTHVRVKNRGLPDVTMCAGVWLDCSGRTKPLIAVLFTAGAGASWAAVAARHSLPLPPSSVGYRYPAFTGSPRVPVRSGASRSVPRRRGCAPRWLLRPALASTGATRASCGDLRAKPYI